jgi:Protein of unknown function (DUF1292).
MGKVEVGERFFISDEIGGEEQEQEVEVLATMTLDGTEYVAVAFVEELEGEDDLDIFFLKVDDEGDLAALESDEEFDKVSEAFDEWFEEDDEDEDFYEDDEEDGHDEEG